MAKVYLAGPWVDRKAMPEIASLLALTGHTTTHNWWDYEGNDQNAESDEFLRDCAEKDLMGVITADAVVVWNTEKSEGKAVEQGIGIACNKPIIVITPGENPTSNIFHHLQNYTHVKTVSEAIKVLEKIRG